MDEDPVYAALQRSAAKQLPHRVPEPPELPPDAPAPAMEFMIAEVGPQTVREALTAWDMRVRGEPIIDIAHQMGITIEGAKRLIKEAHQAIAEDLKDNLEQNRRLDLDRIDGLIKAHYPEATQGKDVKSGMLVLRALERRAKLTGIEPESVPTNTSPHNVLVWIQAQMPRINKIVDALPEEEPPGAPNGS
jgi:hypothetical protein